MGTQAGQVGDEKFSNWVKDTLALLYTKECLEVIADKRSAVFHGQLKAAVGNSKTCSCGWQALERGKRKWVVKNCPGICQRWLDVIIDHHSNRPLPKLAPRNTDPSLWPSDTWEVMKVYQSNGCQGQRSARDADVAALIDLMRNCDHFSPLITNPSFINQVILIRNNLMHSKDFLVDNQQLSCDLQSMLDFLGSLVTVTVIGVSSPSVLTEQQAVQKAITQVDELCTSILDMTLNREMQLKAIKAKQVALEQMINDAIADTMDLKSGMEDKLGSEVQTLQDSLASLLSLIQDVKKGLSDQQQSAATFVTTLACVQQQFDDLKKDLDEIKTEITALKQQISHLEETSQNQQQESQAHESRLEQHQGELDTHATTLQDHATQLHGHQSYIESQQRTLGSHASQLQGHQGQIESQQRTLECHGAKLDRLENKQIAQQTDQPVNIKRLQCQLISLYQVQRQHIPVYLLRSERKVHLEDIYVEQRLKIVDPDGRLKTDNTVSSRRHLSRSLIIKIRQQDTPVADKPETFVSSLRDVFYTDGKKCQNIYVSGNAGYGKSVFCSHLVRLWCNAHSDESRKLTPDEEFMAEFPLLFCIDLRDATYKAADQTPAEIISLIQRQLQLSQLGLTDNDLSKLLQADGQVLVVMDALDECKEERLPRGGLHNKCTTLVTSRPWKLEALRCDPESRVDKELEIVGLEKGSSQKLSKFLIKLLNKKWNKKKDSFDFLEKMEEEGLEKFLDVPVLLTSMLCLWFDDIPFGQSQCEIYKNSIHHQILATVKAKDIPEFSFPSETPFPVCERENCPCKCYGELLWKVSELACKALLGNVRERSLVLDHNQTEFLGLTDEDVSVCMKLGFLTQYKLLGNVTDYEPQKSVSFSHKTYQEWFAAIYLSSKLPVSELDKMLSEAIDDLDSALELDQLFLFVCGMNAEVAQILSQLIMTKASSDARVSEFRMSCCYNHDQLIRNIQDIVVAGADEAKKNNITSIALQLNDVYIEWFMFRKYSTEQIFACDTSQVMSVYINVLAEGDMIAPWPASSCLECLRLNTINDALDDTFFDNFSAANLVHLYLEDVRLAHDQLENLCKCLATARRLKVVEMTELTCTTHMDNRQDCSIILDLSQHQGLESLILDNLGVGEIQEFDLFQNMDKLEKVILDNNSLTHDQLENLCKCIATARRLKVVEMTELTCTTHMDNRQDCSIILDLSQHQGLEILILDNIDVGKVQENKQECSFMFDLSQHQGLEKLTLWNLNMGEIKGQRSCKNMDKLETVVLGYVTLTHDQLESLCRCLATAGRLKVVEMTELTCTTHMDNRQDCSIMFDLSQHQGLETLILNNHGVGEIKGLRFCQNIDKLETVRLGHVTLTNDQLENLCKCLATAKNLKTMDTRELTCTTHKENKQECSFMFDLSQHQGLEKLTLWNLNMGEIKGQRFCKNMDKLETVVLGYVILTHDQLESLCRCLATAGRLKVVKMTELTCTTHMDNRQDCSIMFDLSQHQGLETLILNNHGVGEIKGLRFCQNIDKLETVALGHVTLTHDQLENLCKCLATAKNLKTMDTRELTCTTHKENKQDCSFMFDLSQHQGLKKLRLSNPNMGEIKGQRFCKNMDKLETVVLGYVTLTHDQLESLCRCLATAGRLKVVEMTELTCTTHMDNRQDCSIILDLSQHQGLENLILDNLGVGEIQFFDLFQNMDKLEKVILDNNNNSLTHDQLDSLCKCLATAENLKTINIRGLTCKTHKDNRQECSIMFDLSQHQGLETLILDNHDVGEIKGLKICQNINELETVVLSYVTLTHEQLESLCGILATAQSLREIDIRELTCTTHRENKNDCYFQMEFSHYAGIKSLSFEKISIGRMNLPKIKITSWPSSLCMEIVYLHQGDISQCDKFCADFIVDKLSTLILNDITLTHNQLESLCGNLAESGSLRKVDMRELTCSTHKDNCQECSIVLDLSQHEGLENLILHNLGVYEVRGLCLCQNIDTLEKIALDNITLTHDQIESLCGSLSTVVSLKTVDIRGLDCSTHNASKHECSILLDLSQHRELKYLTLWDPGVGEVQGVNVFVNMDKLQKVHLAGFCISAAALRQTLDALSGLSLRVELGDLGYYSPLRVKGAQEARQLLEEIGQATNTVVTRNRVEYNGDECIIKELGFCNNYTSYHSS